MFDNKSANPEDWSPEHHVSVRKQPVTMAMFEDVILPTFKSMASRLAAVETKGLSYAGTWQRAMDYERGNVVTHDGSAWVALKEAPAGSKPGADPEHWQMMVKAGRDAR